MKKLDIDEALANHLLGKSTEDEQEQLRKWAAKSPANASLLNQMEQVWMEKSGRPKVPNSSDLIDKIWTEATGESTASGKPLSWWKFYGSVAAVLLMLFLSYRYSSYFPFYTAQDTTPQARTVVKKAMAGQKLQVTLPDSTRVWINATSSIEYPEFFSDSTREVKLIGEAFFDVQKDASRSFVVDVKGLKVRALGTAFNVNAFDEKGKTKVTLVEGKVQIVNRENLTVMLHPGEVATYNTLDRKFEKSLADIPQEVGWKEGRMIFKNADFDTVIKQLERWYGVTFVYNDAEKPVWDFTADFSNYSLENVLRVLGFGEGVTFTRKDHNVYLTF